MYMDKGFVVFEKYCRSEATREHYQYWFNDFLGWCKTHVEPMITSEGLLQLKETALQEMIEDYVMEKRKGLSPNTLPLPIASLRLFFDMQDKVLNWKRIKKMIPTQVKKAGYSAYQNDDIKSMLVSGGSKRNRSLIHFMASTGCRIGAIPDLKIKHLSNMPDGCKSVLFYEGSNEEYYGFLTQEASKILDEYLDERRKDGEYLTENSPIFRAEYSVGIQPVKVLTLRGIEAVLERLAKEAVSRKKINKTRCNIMSAHGFRKRCASIIKLNNKISWAVSERLLGHKSYLDPSYFVPTKENLFEEFKKVMADLTIDDSEKERLKRIEAEKKITELQDEKDKTIQELKNDIKNLYKMIEKN
jgi:integrase